LREPLVRLIFAHFGMKRAHSLCAVKTCFVLLRVFMTSRLSDVIRGNRERTGVISAGMWFAGVLSLLPVGVSAKQESAGKENNRLRVTVSGAAKEFIELEANKVLLSAVFDELANKTGIPVHYSVLAETPVTATCAGAGLEPVVKCLLGTDAGLMFRYRNGLSKTASAERPEALWILESSLAGAACTGSDSEDHRGGKARKTDAGKPASKRTRKLLNAAAAGNDPQQRVNALSELIVDKQADPTVVHAVLEKSLTDEDASVRAQAVWGLA
jgi:hypothetical protein